MADDRSVRDTLHSIDRAQWAGNALEGMQLGMDAEIAREQHRSNELTEEGIAALGRLERHVLEGNAATRELNAGITASNRLLREQNGLVQAVRDAIERQTLNQAYQFFAQWRQSPDGRIYLRWADSAQGAIANMDSFTCRMNRARAADARDNLEALLRAALLTSPAPQERTGDGFENSWIDEDFSISPPEPDEPVPPRQPAPVLLREATKPSLSAMLLHGEHAEPAQYGFTERMRLGYEADMRAYRQAHRQWEYERSPEGRLAAHMANALSMTALPTRWAASNPLARVRSFLTIMDAAMFRPPAPESLPDPVPPAFAAINSLPETAPHMRAELSALRKEFPQLTDEF